MAELVRASELIEEMAKMADLCSEHELSEMIDGRQALRIFASTLRAFIKESKRKPHLDA